MDLLFIKVLNMSQAACFVILSVLLIRLPLKRFPKTLSYVLWAVVLVRLLCPVSIKSPFGFIRDPEPVKLEETERPSVGIQSWDGSVGGEIPETRPDRPGTGSPATEDREDTGVDWKLVLLRAAEVVWLLGAAAILCRDLAAYLRLKRELRRAVHLQDNVYQADNIGSSFTLGILRPRIYLPDGLEDRAREFVLLHEKCHIRRLDNVFKALGVLALSIHWFNPLVWVAFAMASEDMEMSCDEAVIRALGDDARADYCAFLLKSATESRIIVRSRDEDKRQFAL